MKKKILILLLFVIAIVLGIFIYKYNFAYTKSKFELDNENKYIITTNMKWVTVRNDGGSHTNHYYQIDLNNNEVIECIDEYVGFEGYKYKAKIINSKEITETEKIELKSILEDVIKNNEKSDELNYKYYLVNSFNSDDVKIYDESIINKINGIIQ